MCVHAVLAQVLVRLEVRHELEQPVEGVDGVALHEVRADGLVKLEGVKVPLQAPGFLLVPEIFSGCSRSSLASQGLCGA